MPDYCLGIDLGGTEVKMAIVNLRGRIVEETNIANSNSFKPDELVHQIVREAKGFKNFKFISGVGVGVAGDIDQARGVVRFSPNLKKWKNIPLKKMLRRYFKGPIAIDNDANVAALGAFYLDAKKKIKNLICVTLGTGVGGGIVLDGKIYRGSTGTAGEIGHIHFDSKGPKCNCGSYGCIECYVGAKGLISLGKKIKSRIIAKLTKGKVRNLTPKILKEAALLGDSGARKIWKDTGIKLGVIFADLVNILNPEMIIISGGISKANDLLIGPIIATIRKRAFKTSVKNLKIEVSKFTSRLGVVGAALLTE